MEHIPNISQDDKPSTAQENKPSTSREDNPSTSQKVVFGDQSIPLLADSTTYVDRELCIICQNDDKQTKLTWTENGRNKIVEASSIRKDIVAKRIALIGENFFYHTTDNCYRKYANSTMLTRILEKRKLETKLDDTENEPTAKIRKSERNLTRSPSPSIDNESYDNICIICDSLRHHGKVEKFRICETTRANKLLAAACYFQDATFTRICDLQDASAVFGADIFCHKKCIASYIQRYEYGMKKYGTDEKGVRKSPPSEKHDTWNLIAEVLEVDFNSGYGYDLCEIRDMMNDRLPSKIQNAEVRVLLENEFGDKIKFSNTGTKTYKSVMVFSSKYDAEVIIEKIRQHKDFDSSRFCARNIREEILAFDFKLNDRFCDASDLENAWNNTVIPEHTLQFLAHLFNVDINCLRANTKSASQKTNKRIAALFQILHYTLNHGKKTTPLHVMNTVSIYDTCKSETLITCFNRLGLCASYDQLLRYNTKLANYTLQSTQSSIPLPSHFDPGLFTTGAFDNFDHTEATLSGIGGCHDTVCVLFQDKNSQYIGKPNVSDSGIVHGPRVLNSELQCQKIHQFFKPSKSAELPVSYVVEDPLVYKLNEAEKMNIAWKDRAIVLGRLDINITEKQVGPVPKEQSMPTWSAANSVLITDTLTEKVVGFMPLIPNPVTQYSTVYTALHNYLQILKQLNQNCIPISCDEGVYHIAREIQLLRPDEFKSITLCLGTFHMAKVVLSCLGKYLKCSGAQEIWTESKVFGVNVVESVLTGRNYNRSMKGMELLSECCERLMWCSFFEHDDVEQYTTLLDLIIQFRTAVSHKDRCKSQEILKSIVDQSSNLSDNFNKFISLQSNPTFKFWATFLELHKLLKNLIRADREGNWKLHIDTVKDLIPIFLVFDSTNYARWCSLYLEDMNLLPITAPEIHEKFMQGHFVVQRTTGCFKSVGMDMALEQTINRSQKSPSGIIGSTAKKNYVVRWELIYHELLAVTNLYRKLCGVNQKTGESKVNHEFSKSKTKSHEMDAKEMITFIETRENPFTNSTGDLHNIVTKEVVSIDVSDNILKVQEIGDNAYSKFRKERFIEKTVKIHDTIHRTNLKTFATRVKPSKESKTKTLRKNVDLGHKKFEIALVRGYSIDELLHYDIVESEYLFKDGMITKPSKSVLVTELEKGNLSESDYSFTAGDSASAAIVDVMANIRKVRSKGLGTFGDFCDNSISYIFNICKPAKRVDLVFDSYINGSIKDCEHNRRGKSCTVDLVCMNESIPLPVNMEGFWQSSANKNKLQLLLRERTAKLSNTKYSNVNIIVSHVMGENGSPCESLLNEKVERLTELECDIEEADCRIIRHLYHCVRDGHCKVLVNTSDTDVIVMLLYFWAGLFLCGLQELWVRAGVVDSIRHIPIHTLATKLGVDLCNVLPAVHTLSGSDYTSKVGTKHGALLAEPVRYLAGFGQLCSDDHRQEIFSKAETYLCNVIKRTTECSNMNDLRVHMYYHTKTALQDLPPTTTAIKAHIARSYYATYMMVTANANHQILKPEHYGFSIDDGSLLPTNAVNEIPEIYSQCCTCGKCATIRCSCRKSNVACCKFCKCSDCKNPIVTLNSRSSQQLSDSESDDEHDDDVLC